MHGSVTHAEGVNIMAEGHAIPNFHLIASLMRPITRKICELSGMGLCELPRIKHLSCVLGY